MSSHERVRIAKLRIGWPTIPYSLRWDDLDSVTGQNGHGLFTALRIWWSLYRGTWRDDWWPFYEEPEDDPAAPREDRERG